MTDSEKNRAVPVSAEELARLRAEIQKLREALAIGVAMAESNAEYAAEQLAYHLRDLGETTQKNKFKAMRLREDASSSADAVILFKTILGLP